MEMYQKRLKQYPKRDEVLSKQHENHNDTKNTPGNKKKLAVSSRKNAASSELDRNAAGNLKAYFNNVIISSNKC